MNAFDIAVIAVILLSGLFAFARGFVKEALSVAAWLGAAAAAIYGMHELAPTIERYLPKSVDDLLPKAMAAQIIAAASIFIVALIVFSILTSAVARRVKESSLSAVDRTLGLIFGLARGIVLVCLAYIALSTVLPDDRQRPAWINEAKTPRYLDIGAKYLQALVPAAYREKAEATLMDEAHRAAAQAREASNAASALRTPHAPPVSGHKPLYTPDDQRGLNRLIQQQQAPQ
jgi:membrane protein required for colicin V production